MRHIMKKRRPLISSTDSGKEFVPRIVPHDPVFLKKKSALPDSRRYAKCMKCFRNIAHAKVSGSGRSSFSAPISDMAAEPATRHPDGIGA